jgi:hypothetical protein
MLHLEVLLIFFGMFWISEYTPASTRSYSKEWNLTTHDVRVHCGNNICFVTLKASNTDAFQLGFVIRVDVTSNELCSCLLCFATSFIVQIIPVHCLCFTTVCFSLENVHLMLQCNLPRVPHINAHLFCQGGASALAAAGGNLMPIIVMFDCLTLYSPLWIVLWLPRLLLVGVSFSHRVSYRGCLGNVV